MLDCSYVYIYIFLTFRKLRFMYLLDLGFRKKIAWTIRKLPTPSHPSWKNDPETWGEFSAILDKQSFSKCVVQPQSSYFDQTYVVWFEVNHPHLSTKFDSTTVCCFPAFVEVRLSHLLILWGLPQTTFLGKVAIAPSFSNPASLKM